mmetsp:Transcript_18038/g.63350  ORF Transcript_18038/g.63350 Transcript_18038/m.63350 type:complete len:103 (-) Transcript_18038:38-346(-)
MGWTNASLRAAARASTTTTTKTTATIVVAATVAAATTPVAVYVVWSHTTALQLLRQRWCTQSSPYRLPHDEQTKGRPVQFTKPSVHEFWPHHTRKTQKGNCY